MANLFKLHRRDFLATATALATSGAARGIKSAPESATTPVSSAALSIPASYPNASAHLAEITKRNLLRQESGLPLLSIPKELRRIKTAEASATFAKFCDSFREPVKGKVLARIRRQLGQPDWKPQGMLSGGGMAFESEVSRNLARVYERVGKCG